MKRAKRHRIKEETSGSVNPKEHDLAYYIHDRVELMHQVFSVLKPKELKAMAPECVRHITVNDLQELCTEELLGISSKRLCAILDGADPPSDTESSSESSQERLETISLDSISSDDEILSQVSTKKKKHKHHSKSKSKKRKSRDSADEEGNQDKSRRTGLTVLEILELQARARAIRAQLQKEQLTVASTGRPSESATGNSSDGEVEIKEEAAEVVEISSEDEKPNVQELQEKIAATTKETANNESNSKTVTRKVNDLVITVPKNPSRKIKLKRTSHLEKNQKTVDVENVPTTSTSTEANKAKVSTSSPNTAKVSTNSQTTVVKGNAITTVSNAVETTESVDKGKDKKKKRKKDKQKEKDGSDHDEITLQLSDTEKMDLLEDLVEKQFEKSSETEDSSADSDSEDDSVDKNKKDKDFDTNKKVLAKVTKEKSKVKVSKGNNEVIMKEMKVNDKEIVGPNGDKESDSVNISETFDTDTSVTEKNITDLSDNTEEVLKKNDEVVEMDHNSKETCDDTVKDREIIDESRNRSNNDVIEMVSENDKELQNTEEGCDDLQKEKEDTVESQEVEVTKTITEQEQSDIEKNKSDDNIETQSQMETDEAKAQSTNDLILKESKESEGNVDKNTTEEKSDGELSDRDSSEVEASEVVADVVCISDEEVRSKKKKKKDKKCKKSKKSKKNKDFRESADQNFYTETSDKVSSTKIKDNDNLNAVKIDTSGNLNSNLYCSDSENVSIPHTKKTEELNPIQTEISPKSDIDDDVYEILELSDDSSCYEVEEISISKEPTAEEIEALSAKIDEIDRDRTIYIDESDGDKKSDTEDLEHVSWKDRYLKSTKVKKVLSTANILNAIRKKNLDLKKKLEESKLKTHVENEVVEDVPSNDLEEGSIEQYNTLETCNKYVDPVKDDNNETEMKEPVTKEMKKDAKQLLKMYKMLLKYNDITKEKDMSKKKKKKKKYKDKDKSQPSDG